MKTFKEILKTIAVEEDWESFEQMLKHKETDAMMSYILYAMKLSFNMAVDLCIENAGLNFDSIFDMSSDSIGKEYILDSYNTIVVNKDSLKKVKEMI